MDFRKSIHLFLILFLVLIFSSVVFSLDLNSINSINSSTTKTPIVYFYSPNCSHCAAIKPFLYANFKDKNEFEFIELNINEHFELKDEFNFDYNVPINYSYSVPIVFAGNKFYLGEIDIKQLSSDSQYLSSCKINLLNDINNTFIDTNDKCVVPINQNNNINFFSVISLALADAVNPCELAVLIILLTAILTKYPKDKKKALKSGLMFTLAIFLMYFVFGLILKEAFSVASGLFGTYFLLIISLFAIIMGILNLKDAFSYGAGGFIMEVPQAWRPKMKKIINKTTSPTGAFFVGLIVAFFLTPCTAGPYIIFASMVSKIALIDALLYMLIYMIIFVSPMLVITLFIYKGIAKIEDVEGWREVNLKKLHFISGVIMLIIGLYVLFQSLINFGIIKF
ncbi:MAG: cytochrome c biogenesis protein CcdA [Candidatus ainarchaeum sp.]|nr:cytochrome c biogenesis protein CcdA [Candidatus ainarchaeum sp.]